VSEAATAIEGLTAAKVDAVAQEELRQQFQIGAFPKILAFKNGRMRGEYTGRREEANVKDILAWGGSFAESTVKEFDGDLARLPKNMVSFALYPSASAEDAQAFEKVAERYAVDGRVEFFLDTSDEYDTPSVVGSCMNKTFELWATKGKTLAMADIERFVKQNQRPWLRMLVPGFNFNEVMYDGSNLAATAHVNMSAPETAEYLKTFNEVAWEMKGSKFNFGILAANQHIKMSTQVGIFEQHMPQIVIFNGQELVYHSDRELPRTKEAIKDFLAKAQAGSLEKKKPGSEKDDKIIQSEAPPPSNKETYKKPKKKPLSDDIPTSLYGKTKSGSERSTEQRLARTEEIMEELLKQQKDINRAIVRLHEELFDLRTDIEPMTDMRFKRVEDPNQLMKQFEALHNDTRSENADEWKAHLMMLAALESWDPYRLGTLRLNNESRYNTWKNQTNTPRQAANVDLNTPSPALP
jgi:hypothetical protein